MSRTMFSRWRIFGSAQSEFNGRRKAQFDRKKCQACRAWSTQVLHINTRGRTQAFDGWVYWRRQESRCAPRKMARRDDLSATEGEVRRGGHGRADRSGDTLCGWFHDRHLAPKILSAIATRISETGMTNHNAGAPFAASVIVGRPKTISLGMVAPLHKFERCNRGYRE
jgi:hypothetical protein